MARQLNSFTTSTRTTSRTCIWVSLLILVLLCFLIDASHAFQSPVQRPLQSGNRSPLHHPIVTRSPYHAPNKISPTATTANLSRGVQSTTTALSLLSPLQGDILRTAIGAVVAAKVAQSGLKKQSLRTSGALSAFAVASLSLACSLRSGITLLFFYWTSSKLTRIGASTKKTLEEDYKVGGKRGASQVLACSLIAIVAAMARRFLVGPDSPLDFITPVALGNRLTLAFVAFFACCAGDTWASELGVLSKSNPRLVIKPWKKVAPGTNGGVSKIGLAASAAGGLAMGLMHGLCLPLQYSLSQRLQETLALGVVGFIGGLGGSWLDSILGATIQVSHYDPVEKMILKKPKEGSIKLGFSLLSNEMVNVVSTAMTAVLAAIFAKPLLSLVL